MQTRNTMNTSNISTPLGNTSNSLKLSISRYRFCFEALDIVQLPAYSGSAWRGVLGHGLKRTVCVTHLPHCKDCMLKHSCAYSTIFETPPPPDTQIMRRYTSVPHPYVLEPDTVLRQTGIQPGGAMILGFSLFGSANRQLPFIIHGLQMAGEKGIGRGQGHFELRKVEQESHLGSNQWLTIYQPGEQLTPITPAPAVLPPLTQDTTKIKFITPLRVKRDHSLAGSDRFEFHDLFRSLLKRISLISYFHSDHPIEPDFTALSASAREVKLTSSNLRWQDWTRYSSRQSTTMQMGGLLGEIEIESQHLEPYWPYLWLGQWTHAGKGTSMGLGQYVIQDAASLPIQLQAAG